MYSLLKDPPHLHSATEHGCWKFEHKTAVVRHEYHIACRMQQLVIMMHPLRKWKPFHMY